MEKLVGKAGKHDIYVCINPVFISHRPTIYLKPQQSTIYDSVSSQIEVELAGKNVDVRAHKWSVRSPRRVGVTYKYDTPESAVKEMFARNREPTPEFPSGKEISKIVDDYLSKDSIDAAYLPLQGISVERIVLTTGGLRAMEIIYLKEPRDWNPTARWEGGVYPADEFDRADTLPKLIEKMNERHKLQKGTLPSVEKIINEIMGLACSQGKMLENKKSVAA